MFGANGCNIYSGHPTATEYTFFSSAYGTFFRVEHLLGSKCQVNLKKLNLCQVSPCKEVKLLLKNMKMRTICLCEQTKHEPVNKWIKNLRNGTILK